MDLVSLPKLTHGIAAMSPKCKQLAADWSQDVFLYHMSQLRVTLVKAREEG